LALPHGITGTDTFRRVLELKPAAAFQRRFQQRLLTLQAFPDEIGNPKSPDVLGIRRPESQSQTASTSSDRSSVREMRYPSACFVGDPCFLSAELILAHEYNGVSASGGPNRLD